MERPVDSMSGGERNLLVLDEPGNHLDFAGLAWLEKFLQKWDGTVLVVSHNRYPLDRVADRIFELDNRRLSAYEGTYSRYRLEKLRALVARQADYAANQKRLARLEALVARFAEIARVHADPA
jgi:ATP-binding cassette subfamily F protein 3